MRLPLLRPAPFAAAAMAFAVFMASCGGGDDPSLVEHGQTASDGGVELTLESVRYGGTGTIAFVSPGGEAGAGVSLKADAIATQGFEDDPSAVLHETTDGVTVRLPPVDAVAAEHRLTFAEVTVADGTSRAGDWSFDLELPPEADREDAFRTESLVLNAGDFGGQVEVTRSTIETLVIYDVPPDAVPLTPPELTAVADDDAIHYGVLLPGYEEVDGMHRYRASLAATDFGNNVELRMGLFGEPGAEALRASVDLQGELGETPGPADEFEVEPGHDPGDERLEIVRVQGHESSQAFGGLLPAEGSANLAVALDMPVDPGAQARGHDGGNAESVIWVLDAHNRVIPVRAWGQQRQSGGEPDTTMLDAQATGDHDLSRVTVVVAEGTDAVYPPEPALLVPAGE